MDSGAAAGSPPASAAAITAMAVSVATASGGQEPSGGTASPQPAGPLSASVSSRAPQWHQILSVPSAPADPLS